MVPAMVTSMCRLGESLVPSYLIKHESGCHCEDCLVDVVDIHTQVTGSKGDYAQSCGQALSNPLEVLKSKNGGFLEKKKFCPKTAT